MIDSEAQARDYIFERAGADAIERLERLQVSLSNESRRQNLISASSIDAIWVRHFADSAQLSDFVPRGTQPWVDFGAGAGFPGLVLAIMQPDTTVRLIESRRRRIDWLQFAVKSLDLQNVRIEGKRAEAVATFEAGVITARAFAPLPKLLDLCARFSTAATYWVLPKGRGAAQELQMLESRRADLFHVEQSLTDRDAQILVGKGKIR